MSRFHMNYFHWMYWRQKTTWAFVIMTLAIRIGLVILLVFGTQAYRGVDFGGSRAFSEAFYKEFFFDNAMAFIVDPVYAFGVAAMSRYLQDVKFVVRTGSRAGWVRRYLSLSCYQAGVFLLLLNIPACIAIWMMGGSVAKASAFILVCMAGEYLVLVTFSMVWLLVQSLTNSSVAAAAAMILYGAWDALFGIYDYADTNGYLITLDLGIGWSRVFSNIDESLDLSKLGKMQGITSRLIDPFSAALLAGLLALFILLSLAAVRRKDFLTVQEEAAKA